jgi:hypothetical protein
MRDPTSHLDHVPQSLTQVGSVEAVRCQETSGYFLVAHLVCESHIVVIRSKGGLFHHSASFPKDSLSENPNLSQIIAGVLLILIGLDEAETTPLNS